MCTKSSYFFSSDAISIQGVAFDILITYLLYVYTNRHTSCLCLSDSFLKYQNNENSYGPINSKRAIQNHARKRSLTTNRINVHSTENNRTEMCILLQIKNILTTRRCIACI